ncbi:MAG: DUF1801 domain-containing protein [Rhizobiales bacterium]|nr:DUF1801 domain-containing protein [Hyphomicrobiales bacterium]
MLYEVKTPEDYFNKLDNDWRQEKLLQLRAIIKEKAPELEETINYKMLGYGVGDAFVFHLNAQKNYVSLYVGNVLKIDPNGAMLKGLNVGKGCIRFTKTKSIEDTRIDEFIACAVNLWREGVDTEC